MSAAARWGLCCREGDPLQVMNASGCCVVPRSPEYLEMLHQRFPDSELRTGEDGKLELWTWVNEQGRRVRRPEATP